MLRQLDHFAGLHLFPIHWQDDHRGSYAETFNQAEFQRIAREAGEFPVDAQANSSRRNVVRGLHFQYPPQGKSKMIRVLQGAIYDVVVDVRTGSPTYGDHAALELTSGDGRQLFVPAGFAHGYRTLVENTAVQYKSSAYFDPELAAGVRWDDPRLAIAWSIPPAAGILSDFDRGLPTLAEIEPRLAAARWADKGKPRLVTPSSPPEFRSSDEIFQAERAFSRSAFLALREMALSLPPFRIFCVRHGQTEDNARGLLSGQRDVELTAAGRQQAAEITIPRPDTIAWVFASDLIRARQTAAVVAARCWPQCRLYLDNRLREITLGIHEGQSLDALASKCCIDTRFPGGESYTDLFGRVASFIYCLLTLKLRSGAAGDCLLFGHAGTWRIMRSFFQPTTHLPQLFAHSLANGAIETYHSHALAIPEIWQARLPG